jgi:serine/threonine protein kinase
MFNSPLLSAEDSGWEKPDLADLIPRLDPLAQDLLENMLKINPALRFTAKTAKKHPYFDGYCESFTKEIVYE